MPKTQWNGNHELAKTFMQALLGPPRARHGSGAQSLDWTCRSCKWSNYATRPTCRHCGAAPGPASSKSTPSATAAPAPQAKGAAPKPPPWERAKAAAAQVAALEAAMAAAQLAGGAEDLVKDLTEKLTAARKAAQDDRPLPDRLAGIRAYISRAEKRLDAAVRAVKEAEDQRDSIGADLASHKEKLEELEKEADRQRGSSMETDGAEQSGANSEPEEFTQLRLQMAQLSEEVEKLQKENKVMRQAGRGLEDELSVARPELEAARAQKTAAEKKHAELRALGSSELTARVAKCFRDHQQALTDSKWVEAESLAEMTGKLTAALREAGEQEAQAGSSFNPNS